MFVFLRLLIQQQLVIANMFNEGNKRPGNNDLQIFPLEPIYRAQWRLCTIYVLSYRYLFLVFSQIGDGKFKCSVSIS